MIYGVVQIETKLNDQSNLDWIIPYAKPFLADHKNPDRLPLFLDENIPVVKLYPPRSNEPSVKVYVPVAANANDWPNVTVPNV